MVILIFFISLFYFYLFLAVLGLCCRAWAFSSWGEWGLLFVLVCGLLTAVASLVAEHRLQACRLLGVHASVVVACRLSSCGSRDLEHSLSSCGTWAQLLRGMWDLPGPGLKPMSPASAGGFLTIAPPGKSEMFFWNSCYDSTPHAQAYICPVIANQDDIHTQLPRIFNFIVYLKIQNHKSFISIFKCSGTQRIFYISQLSFLLHLL